MGNTQSQAMYQNLYRVLANKNSKRFENDDDRDQFIYAVITIITQNGARDLREHAFRLLYSRRPNERLVAILVAEKDGAIMAKIQPTRDGKTQIEAFKELKREVELRLDLILQEVPAVDDTNSLNQAGPSTAPRIPAQQRAARSSSGRQQPPASPIRQEPTPLISPIPMDAPPSYGNIVNDQKRG